MSVLKSYFDKSVNQASRVCSDLSRVVNVDDRGSEVVTWCPVDYPSLQASNGLVTDWSLDSLLKAGVDPSFPIHTGAPTRIEGVATVSKFASQADSILSSSEDVDND